MFAAVIAALSQLAALIPTFLQLGSDIAPLITFITGTVNDIKSGNQASADEIAQLDAIAKQADDALQAAVADNAARAAAGEGQVVSSGGAS